jgi:hypothetical protein
MRKYFDYTRSDNEEFNALVDGALELARSKYEGHPCDDYKKKNEDLIYGMGKKAVEGTRYEAEFEAKGLELLKNPMVRNNSTFRDNFNAVIAQVINVIVPEVVNDTFVAFIAETHQTGYG